MLEHIGIRPIIANSTPINNKIRIQIMPNNDLQLYTTYDMRYTKPQVIDEANQISNNSRNALWTRQCICLINRAW